MLTVFIAKIGGASLAVKASSISQTPAAVVGLVVPAFEARFDLVMDTFHALNLLAFWDDLQNSLIRRVLKTRAFVRVFF